AATIHCGASGVLPNHAVPISGSLDLPEIALPIPPYALGAWLGTANSAPGRFIPADPEVAMRAEAAGMAEMPQEMAGDKHIPVAYLRAEQSQRRELLAGILDTAGTVTRTGSVRVSLATASLARGARELILSLGYRCPVIRRAAVGYAVTFASEDQVF